MPTWPASLPAYLINTYSESPPDNVIRTSMSKGVDKVRRRTTSNARPISFEMILTSSQLDTLETFYVTTTESGSLSFDYTHPRTDASVIARFTSPPSYSDIYGRAFRVSVELEILP